MNCTECIAFGKFCPHKPDRKDYDSDENFLVDLETGVYDCRKTIQVMTEKINSLERTVREYSGSYDELREHGIFIKCMTGYLEKMAKERGMK